MIQNYFDNEAISMLPTIKTFIDNADDFEANQMRCIVLREIMNSRKSLKDMSESEKAKFQAELILKFEK